MTTLVNLNEQQLFTELTTRSEALQEAVRGVNEIERELVYRLTMNTKARAVTEVQLAEAKALLQAKDAQQNLPALAGFPAELSAQPALPDLPDLDAAAAALAAAETDGTGPLYEAIGRIVDTFLVKRGVLRS